MSLDEKFQIVGIINKLTSLWKDFKNTLRHKMKEFSLESLITWLKIKEEVHKHDQKKEMNTFPKKKSIVIMKPDLKSKGIKWRFGTEVPTTRRILRNLNLEIWYILCAIIVINLDT